MGEVGFHRLPRASFADREQGIALPLVLLAPVLRQLDRAQGLCRAPGRLPRRRSREAGRRLPPAPAWRRLRRHGRPARPGRGCPPSRPHPARPRSSPSAASAPDRARRSEGGPACGTESPTLLELGCRPGRKRRADHLVARRLPAPRAPARAHRSCPIPPTPARPAGRRRSRSARAPSPPARPTARAGRPAPPSTVRSSTCPAPSPRRAIAPSSSSRSVASSSGVE